MTPEQTAWFLAGEVLLQPDLAKAYGIDVANMSDDNIVKAREDLTDAILREMKTDND